MTQATLSRDLRYLRVAKVPEAGGYVYAFTDEDSQTGSRQRLIDEISSGFVSIGFSGNCCVLHTAVGHAAAVALAMDRLPVPGLLGTVAGDDTIIAILMEGVTADDFRRQLVRLVPELEGMTR